MVLALIYIRTIPVLPAASITRFPFSLPDGQKLTRNSGQLLTISPDGDRIVYVANHQLYMREMSNPQPHVIGGTADAMVPFFSPDGRWIGFYAGSERKLKKVSVTGGSAVTICEIGELPNGASWAVNDQVFFAQRAGIF